jgi:hypothetical protein
MEFIEDLITVYLFGSIISILMSMIYTACFYRCSGEKKSDLISRFITAGILSWVSAIITMIVCVEIATRNIDIERHKYNSKYLDTRLLVKLRKEAQSAYEIHKLKDGGFMVIGDKSTKYWNSELMFSMSEAKHEYTRVVIQRMKVLVSCLRHDYRVIEYSPWDKVTKL